MPKLEDIEGIGKKYGAKLKAAGVRGTFDLLEKAGVDTIPELQQRKADSLFDKLVKINAVKKLVRQLPSLKQVSGWISQAKKLPRIITY